MIFIQNAAQQAAPKISQATVLGILIASTLMVIGLLGLLGIFAWRTERALDYGSFFVVVLGILTALIGFLVAFPLLVSRVFDEPAQVLALLSALFGTIVGLVGTFFGIKTSADARKDAQALTRETIASDTTLPMVSSVSPLPNALGVSPTTHVTATFSLKTWNPPPSTPPPSSLLRRIPALQWLARSCTIHPLNGQPFALKIR